MGEIAGMGLTRVMATVSSTTTSVLASFQDRGVHLSPQMIQNPTYRP
jgi:hypothetical protein